MVVPVSSIVIEKTATSEPANGTAYISGETITYSIVVTNDGDTTLTDVVVTDELTGDEWTVDSLAPGETEEFEAEYVVTDEDAEAGTVLNVATVTYTDPDNVPGYNEDDEEDPIEGTLDLTVRKVWNDQNNVAEIRPNRLVVTLNANGTAIQTVTLNADNNWTATVEDLPAMADGQPITYSWTEAEVLGYTQTGNVADGNTTTITNTYTPTPPIPVTIDEYETPLGLDVEINHVGDTFD